MKLIKIANSKNNEILGDKIIYANTPYRRFIGLMGKKEINEGQGVFLTPCNSIHMMFMKFPIDIIFLDRKNKIIHITENIQPWKISKIVFMAQSVLELPVGSVSKTDSKVGDKLTIEF
ncbi:MAG: DUF192 domain-containing protein [Candidatus Sericytochromatia bacterium]